MLVVFAIKAWQGKPVHIESVDDLTNWLEEKIERELPNMTITKADQQNLLSDLIKAEGLEQFLHKKYPGTKRFGVDGGEALVAALHQLARFTNASITSAISSAERSTSRVSATCSDDSGVE